MSDIRKIFADRPWLTRASTERPILLRAARMLDVKQGRMITPGSVLVQKNLIAQVGGTEAPIEAIVVDLGDMTLLPGLMDMELDLILDVPPDYMPRFVQEDRRSAPCAA